MRFGGTQGPTEYQIRNPQPGLKSAFFTLKEEYILRSLFKESKQLVQPEKISMHSETKSTSIN